MNSQTKILIVDNETVHRDFFDLMFSKLGFIVEKARDGIEGLEKTKRFLPDIILLDNIMPRMSGWELTKILKNDPKYKDILIIMFSALDDVKDKVDALELGVDDYITKPFNFTEVLARIRALLRNRELYAQIVAREFRLNLAEELSADIRRNLREFAKTIDGLDAAIAAISSAVQIKPDAKGKKKVLSEVAEKSQQVRQYIGELGERIERTSSEWERLKQNEIGLPLLETKIRENPAQE
ncbi:MAG: response regulator [Treponema sp.]|nr:response regulator [Treponema sp.]